MARPAAVIVFANAPVEGVTLENGDFVHAADIDGSLFVYTRLEELNFAERSLFPDVLDVAVVVENKVGTPLGRVVVEVSVVARVGPLLADPEIGVTDIARGRREAVWGRAPMLQRRAEFQLDRPARYYAVTVKSLAWREAIDRLAASRKWPFEIDVVAKLSCAECDPKAQASRRLTVTPGD